MSSFKLEGGGSAKQQTKSAGVLLLVLGLVSLMLIDPQIGCALIALGCLALLIGYGASS